MQLHPREQFSIVRQIEDWTDSATYYVRAVIRNAKTDAVITVNGNNYLNLTDRTGQRFSANWLVPADPSGQGFWISILTSVYTDSGYTTKSQNYGDKMETYLVQDRTNPNLGGVGGGSDIDYKRVRKIVDEVVKEHIGKIEIPEIPKMPEIKEVDLETPIKALKNTLVGKIEGINIPKMPNMKPIMDKIEDMMAMIEDKHSENGDMNKSSKQELIDCTKNTGKEVLKSFENLNQKLDTMKIEVRMINPIINPQGEIIKEEDTKKTPIYDPRITRLMKSK